MTATVFSTFDLAGWRRSGNLGQGIASGFGYFPWLFIAPAGKRVKAGFSLMKDPNKYKAIVLDAKKRTIEEAVFDTWLESAKFLRENKNPAKRWTAMEIIHPDRKDLSCL